MEGWQKWVLHRPAKTEALRGLRVRASHLPPSPGSPRGARHKPPTDHWCSGAHAPLMRVRVGFDSRVVYVLLASVAQQGERRPHMAEARRFEPCRMHHASVAEQADAVGSNPTGRPCRFESCRWHQADVAKAAKAAGLNPAICEFESRHRHRVRRSPCSHRQGLHALWMP